MKAARQAIDIHTHAHVDTHARTHERNTRHRFALCRGDADKPAKASHQTGIACATAGDAPRRTPVWKAQGEVRPKRPASYLAVGVFCQVTEDKGREFLI